MPLHIPRRYRIQVPLINSVTFTVTTLVVQPYIKVKEAEWLKGIATIVMKRKGGAGTSESASVIESRHKVFATSWAADSYLFTSSDCSRPSPKISTGTVPCNTTTEKFMSSCPTPSECDTSHSDVDHNGNKSETPIARNLRVDNSGIYVDVESREHFFTWAQFEQFLLDENNTAHLPLDDVVRRTADILRENKKAQA
ncbi:hypothetical protein BT69DRAFT_1345276 [Atractiella rhizophila]|nr:hypothetical protein BT69DRAFT_1345276 [Atractiella rhizophila]